MVLVEAKPLPARNEVVERGASVKLLLCDDVSFCVLTAELR